jgi:protocatechuate 3,4-dioxygenase beta subunit
MSAGRSENEVRRPERPGPVDQEIHDHDRGLAFDLGTLVHRRRALQLLGGAGLLTLAACASNSSNSGGSGSTSTRAGATTSPTAATATSGASCTAIPEETAGPYPGDGSNGPNVLTESGVVRRDITSSFGSASGVADGVPLVVVFNVVSLADGCRALPDAAVYAWHCDREGRYSMYSEGVENENWLRGVQASDASGRAEFASIYPGAYQGRWPHIHFEVYSGLDAATSAGSKLATSQIAFPEEQSTAVYATTGYEQSESNFAGTSIEDDMVFGDGYSAQLGSVTGSVQDGYTITLTVAV